MGTGAAWNVKEAALDTCPILSSRCTFPRPTCLALQHYRAVKGTDQGSGRPEIGC